METNEARRKVDKFKVGSVPTIIYIPNFISDAEEDQLVKNIYKAPISKWKTLQNRRLQNWGGLVHEKGLIAQDLPPWLTTITHRIQKETALFPSSINHVLINEYLPHQGIMPHQDGPAYHPVVSILSLRSPVVMDFTPHPSLSGSSASILLMPRSLLVFMDEAYSEYLHGIQDGEVHSCREAVNGEGDEFVRRTGTRLSLTCRVVSKVHKNLFRL